MAEAHPGRQAIAGPSIAKKAHELATGDATSQPGCLAGVALEAAGVDKPHVAQPESPDDNSDIILSVN